MDTELKYITVAELFGDPPSKAKMESLASNLEALSSVSRRIRNISRIKNAQKRAESLAGIYLLSKMADLSQGELTCTPDGKPHLNRGPEFNISHSFGLAVCVTDSEPIGIDVEMLRHIGDAERLAKRYFSLEEQRRIDLADDREREILRIWTKKEAYLKMTGEGLAGNIAELNTESLSVSFRELTVTVDGAEYFITVCKQN